MRRMRRLNRLRRPDITGGISKIRKTEQSTHFSQIAYISVICDGGLPSKMCDQVESPFGGGYRARHNWAKKPLIAPCQKSLQMRCFLVQTGSIYFRLGWFAASERWLCWFGFEQSVAGLVRLTLPPRVESFFLRPLSRSPGKPVLSGLGFFSGELAGGQEVVCG
jgi:hypothetical protein